MPLLDAHGRPVASQALPFKPESLPEARNRYPLALEKIHNISRIRHKIEEAPSKDRTHVFDFKSGIRLIISLDYAPLNPPEDRGPFEHLSASVNSQHLRLPPHQSPLEEVMRIYHYISRFTPETAKEVAHHEISEGGVWHCLFHRPDQLERAKREILGDFPTPRPKNA